MAAAATLALRAAGRNDLLVETFPRGEHEYLVAYCFEGRNAHQTLGMLLTRRMERAGFAPLGFVATDYVLAVWCLEPAQAIDALFDEDMLGDDLEAWMAEISHAAAHVPQRRGDRRADRAHLSRRGEDAPAGDGELRPDLRRAAPAPARPHPAARDAGRCRRRADRRPPSRRDAGAGQGPDRTWRLAQVSPLAVPVLLEIGREQVYGSALDTLLDAAAQELIAEATGTAAPKLSPRSAPTRKKTVTQPRLI